MLNIKANKVYFILNLNVNTFFTHKDRKNLTLQTVSSFINQIPAAMPTTSLISGKAKPQRAPFIAAWKTPKAPTAATLSLS